MTSASGSIDSADQAAAAPSQARPLSGCDGWIRAAAMPIATCPRLAIAVYNSPPFYEKRE
jgi:hypothetical protein